MPTERPIHPEAKDSLDKLLDGVGQEGVVEDYDYAEQINKAFGAPVVTTYASREKMEARFDMAAARKKFAPVQFHAKQKDEIADAVGALVARIEADGADPAKDIKEIASILQSMSCLLREI